MGRQRPQVNSDRSKKLVHFGLLVGAGSLFEVKEKPDYRLLLAVQQPNRATKLGGRSLSEGIHQPPTRQLGPVATGSRVLIQQ